MSQHAPHAAPGLNPGAEPEPIQEHVLTDLSVIRLSLNSKGQMLYICPEYPEGLVVNPVSAFPFSAPGEEMALMDEHGKERLWIQDSKQLETLDADSRRVLGEFMSIREFRPIILRIESVSTYNTPSEWKIRTQQGVCDFVLKNEESIRRLPRGELLLTHSNGMQFVIPKLSGLDAHSRKLLARFM